MFRQFTAENFLELFTYIAHETNLFIYITLKIYEDLKNRPH